MDQDGLLEGKVALVTGGGSGIGQATAFVLARYGARVVIAEIDASSGEETARRVRAEGGDAIFVRADVARGADVQAAVRATVDRHGRIDCAFNNAGIEGAYATVADTTEEEWDRVISVNLKGVFLCMKYELDQMARQGSGVIVNNSSVAGLVGVASISSYAASKHGVLGLTRSAALEYAARGIRINAVCPGAVLTPLMEQAFRVGALPEDQIVAQEPIGRLGKPIEIAEAVAWLCSDKASFMTGQAMAVDGGWTTR